MVVIAPKEPLLVSQDVLDAALAIIRDICARHGFEPRVEVGVERDPEIPGPPIQLLTVWTPELGTDPVQKVVDLNVEVGLALRQAQLSMPDHAMETWVRPDW